MHAGWILSFLTGIVFTIAVIVCVIFYDNWTSTRPKKPSSFGDSTAVGISQGLDESCEFNGYDHGYTTLGGVRHITCLVNEENITTMYCHTHKQAWQDCIAQFVEP